MTLIERVLTMMDREIARAPSGLIDRSLEVLRRSIGKDWNGLIQELATP